VILKVEVVRMANTSQNIPYAINVETGRRIKPEEGSTNARKGLYECFNPECRNHVFVSISKRGRAFFKHYPIKNDVIDYKNAHSKSQDTHTRAIELLSHFFINGLERKSPMPLLLFETPHGVQKVLPFLYKCIVKKEFTIEAINKRIDLAIVDENNNPILLIEVNHKHQVPLEKEIALKQFWWIEVNAKEVINNPSNLVVRKHRNFPYEFDLLGAQDILF
jgi:hypothetical protein